MLLLGRKINIMMMPLAFFTFMFFRITPFYISYIVPVAGVASLTSLLAILILRFFGRKIDFRPVLLIFLFTICSVALAFLGYSTKNFQ
jgi:uncharacterized membrane protein YdfJ with MMPL/SSD domain